MQGRQFICSLASAMSMEFGLLLIRLIKNTLYGGEIRLIAMSSASPITTAALIWQVSNLLYRNAMNFNIEIVQRPKTYVTGFCVGRSQDDLKAAILRNKKVTLDISFYTKTSLNVSLNIEDISFRCSYVPAGCENLKFHTTPGHNMWTSGNYEANYFKILKRQKWNEFKKYGMALIDSLRLDTKETITLRFLIDEDIMEKMGIVEGTQTGFFHHFKND